MYSLILALFMAFAGGFAHGEGKAAAKPAVKRKPTSREAGDICYSSSPKSAKMIKRLILIVPAKTSGPNFWVTFAAYGEKDEENWGHAFNCSAEGQVYNCGADDDGGNFKMQFSERIARLNISVVNFSDPENPGPILRPKPGKQMRVSLTKGPCE